MPAMQVSLLWLTALFLTPTTPDPVASKRLALTVRPIGTSGLVWLGIRNTSVDPQTVCITDSMWTLLTGGDSPAGGQWEHQSAHGPCGNDRSWVLILPGETHFYLRGDRKPFDTAIQPAHIKVAVIAFVGMTEFRQGQLRSELIETVVPLKES
jgi:hypothetical protein